MLLYADDTIILAENKRDLQTTLDSVQEYCTKMVSNAADRSNNTNNVPLPLIKMNVVKGEKELLSREVGELRKEVGELTKEVGELRVQSINKDKEVSEVKTKEEDSWAIVAKKMKCHNVFDMLEKVESHMIVEKFVIRNGVQGTNEEEAN